MRGIRDTSTDTYRKLMGNGLRYEVPKFQRDYSWETEQWDDLWQDIAALYSREEAEHYLGYLVLQTGDNKTYQIIDGQQRITTLSLLILAVLRRLQDFIEANNEVAENTIRRDTLRSSYIGYLDPVTLITNNKLRLNRNNDEYYRHYLAPLVQPLPIRNLSASVRAMRNCFLWYYDRIKSTYATGQALAQFVDFFVDRLFFTVITVSDQLNAFKVFETLNARGIQLSSADLLKNYLFSIVDDGHAHVSEIDELESLWSKIIGSLGNDKLPDFLRYYWNSHKRIVRKTNLFKAVRKEITDKGAAFALVRELDKAADIYKALQNPEDELWQTRPAVREAVSQLRLFRVRQPISMLLAAWRSLSERQFEQLLKACAAISFRYNVIGGRNPNDQEVIYNQIALAINHTGTLDLTKLEPVYVPDAEFETTFATAVFKGGSERLVRYILMKLESYIYGHQLNAEGATMTIEHVLPESAPHGWGGLSDEELDRCVYRLGNLSLLEKSLNQEAAAKTFEEKRSILRRSASRLTQQIADDWNEWNEMSIAERQRMMARAAKTIWRLNF